MGASGELRSTARRLAAVAAIAVLTACSGASHRSGTSSPPDGTGPSTWRYPDVHWPDNDSTRVCRPQIEEAYRALHPDSTFGPASVSARPGPGPARPGDLVRYRVRELQGTLPAHLDLYCRLGPTGTPQPDFSHLSRVDVADLTRLCNAAPDATRRGASDPAPTDLRALPLLAERASPHLAELSFGSAEDSWVCEVQTLPRPRGEQRPLIATRLRVTPDDQLRLDHPCVADEVDPRRWATFSGAGLVASGNADHFAVAFDRRLVRIPIHGRGFAAVVEVKESFTPSFHWQLISTSGGVLAEGDLWGVTCR